MTLVCPHKEVRLAVVMYGGVSLAIYINGVSQELFQLSLATATQEDGTGAPRAAKPPLKADDELTGAATTYRLLARLLSLPEAELGKHEEKLALAGSGGDPQQRLEEIAASLQDRPIGIKFVIDTLCGTSAGGINAVYLGKALACNADPGALKQLWIKEADIGELINDRHGRGLLDTPRPPRSLLNGKRMYVKLLKALESVGRTGDTSKPSGHVTELDVTLTTTDLRGVPIQLKLADGFAAERRLKDSFTFRYREYGADQGAASGGDQNDFEAKNDPLMAFAARCTSSFPFAFEPAQMTTLGAVRARLPEQRAGFERMARWPDFLMLARSRRAQGEDSATTQARAFADGGYLDNKPFSFAVDALVSRVADVPVERKLVYIEPSPELIGDTPEEPPNAIENAFLGLSLARYETIREDLERVLERNRLVERTQRLLSYVDDDLHHEFARGPIDTRMFVENGLSFFLERFGASYGGYHRLKVGVLTDQLAAWVASAAGLDPNSDYDIAIRTLVSAWRTKRYGRETAERGKDETNLLYEFDLEFRIRRLRFVLGRLGVIQLDVVNGKSTGLRALLAKLATSVADPGWPEVTAQLESALAELRAQLQVALIGLLRARRFLNLPNKSNPLQALLAQSTSTSRLQQLMQELIECKTDAAREDHAKRALDDEHTDAAVEEVTEALRNYLKEASSAARQQVLKSFEAATGQVVTDASSAWSSALAKLCKRFYDYYHHYDFLSFPLTYSTAAGAELVAVDVVRVSPADAKTLVKPEEGRRKLAGTDLMNFSAFFQENWRRNDILWGRLDGAERLITSLVPPGLDTLRALLIRDAQQRILKDHYALLTPDPLAKGISLLTERIAVEYAEQQKPDSAASASSIARLSEWLGTKYKVHQKLAKNDPIAADEVKSAVHAALVERAAAHRVWDYFASPDGYRVNMARDPQIWADALSRGSRVTGRILESISTEKKLGAGASAARWLTRAATGAWGLVIVATPDSLGHLLMRHWVKLLALLSVLLIILGALFASSDAQVFGWRMLGITVVLGFAWWGVCDVLAGRARARTVLLWAVLLLAAFGGVKLFSWVKDLLGSAGG